MAKVIFYEKRAAAATRGRRRCFASRDTISTCAIC